MEYGDYYTRVNRKKALKPNITYTDTNGYKYITDSMGRIINVEADLTLGTARRNAYAQRKVGGEDRQSIDDGGHLIGSQFNGSGQIDNLVPQSSIINRNPGEWYQMEQYWASVLRDDGTVRVNINVNYSRSSVRPSYFDVDYWINGMRTRTSIDN